MITNHRPAPHPAPAPLSLKPLLAVGLLCALAGLTLDRQSLSAMVPPLQTTATPISADSCTAVIQSDSRLTREQLAQVLTIPERDTKSRVRQIVNEPYCQYTSLQVRSGVNAEREAYPLAFDPDTKLVILYENDEYAGYRFNFD